jgi:hypothetical protein
MDNVNIERSVLFAFLVELFLIFRTFFMPFFFFSFVFIYYICDPIERVC